MKAVVGGPGDTGAELLRRMAKRRRRDNIAVALLATLAVFGGGHAIIDLFSADPPGPSEEGTTAVVGRAQLAGAFAEQFVTTYLTSTAGQQDRVGEYTDAGQRVTLPTIGRQVSDPVVAYVSRELSSSGLDVWSVTVSVRVGKTGAKLSDVRQFYRVAISVIDGTLRALSLPALVPPPGKGAELATAYSSPCAANTQLAQVASGFLTAMLTTSGDVARYTTVDAGIAALRPAPFSALETVTVTADDGSCGTGTTEARVLVTVNPKADAEVAPTLVYPLSMVNTGGQWQVRAMDVVPALANPVTVVTSETSRDDALGTTTTPSSTPANIPPATQN